MCGPDSLREQGPRWEVGGKEGQVTGIAEPKTKRGEIKFKAATYTDYFLPQTFHSWR
jgi:hypothetical protein